MLARFLVNFRSLGINESWPKLKLEAIVSITVPVVIPRECDAIVRVLKRHFTAACRQNSSICNAPFPMIKLRHLCRCAAIRDAVGVRRATQDRIIAIFSVPRDGWPESDPPCHTPDSRHMSDVGRSYCIEALWPSERRAPEARMKISQAR